MLFGLSAISSKTFDMCVDCKMCQAWERTPFRSSWLTTAARKIQVATHNGLKGPFGSTWQFASSIRTGLVGAVRLS